MTEVADKQIQGKLYFKLKKKKKDSTKEKFKKKQAMKKNDNDKGLKNGSLIYKNTDKCFGENTRKKKR